MVNPARTQGVYRDGEPGMAARLAELRRAAAGAGVPAELCEVYVARVGRTGAGAVAVAGAAWMVLCALGNGSRAGLTALLLGAWAAGAVAYLVARAAAWLRLHWLLARVPAPTGDVATHPARSAGAQHADLERLERATPARVVRDLADRRERSSVAWPLAALALLAPLTLHYLYYLATAAPVARGSFDGWIGLSIAVVGHCHLLLAVLCWRFARRVRRRSAAELGHAPAHDGWVALGLVTLASLVPGVALLGIPVLLVAVTGLLFIPAMFHWASLRVRRERHALALDVG